MPLFLKELKKEKRSAWLFYPNMPNRSEIKVCSVTVVRPEASEESVQRLLRAGLEQLAQEKHLILCFPNPEERGWNQDGYQEADIRTIAAFQEAMNRKDDEPVPVNEKGIPTYEFMQSTWHPMNDTHYYIGIDSGASILAAMMALRPQNMAAMVLIGGEVDKKTIEKAVASPVPAWLYGCGERLKHYVCKTNGVENSDRTDTQGEYWNAINPACRVVLKNEKAELNTEILEQIWKELFSKTRRLNTSVYGDCADRTDLTDAGFEWFVDNTEIDGNPHTWLVHVPTEVRNEQKNVPVVFFYHGGSDNPSEAAEMSRFHEIGEKEHFITVYPWSTNRAGWNMELLKDQADDLAYCKELILYMLKHYPVDPSRVYLSGFSNGAGMAQTVAMIYPELVAALGHIDSNWPGVRYGRVEVDYQTVEPMRIALEKQQERQIDMPVWYTYGTREASSPVCRGCSQQHQYDFWKQFNRIEVKLTRELEDPLLPEHGVDGDTSETLYPDIQHPDHYYTVQHFFNAEGRNYYNFALMHHKGHEVAPKDAQLSWNYMKQFRREKDGTVKVSLEN